MFSYKFDLVLQFARQNILFKTESELYRMLLCYSKRFTKEKKIEFDILKEMLKSVIKKYAILLFQFISLVTIATNNRFNKFEFVRNIRKKTKKKTNKSTFEINSNAMNSNHEYKLQCNDK